MWNTIETSLDTARSYIGWQDILCQFRACRPKEDKPLKAYFNKLSNYHLQLHHTDDAITDPDFRTQWVTSLPSQYGIILMVLKHRRPLQRPEEAMHALLEEETTASVTRELANASTVAALFTQHGGYHVRGRGHGGYRVHGGRGGHGGSRGTGDSYETQCTYCKFDSHTTDACWKGKRAQEGGNKGGNNECICFQCVLPGHVKVDCISYKRIKEW